MSNTHGSNWIRKDLRYAIYHRDNFCCVYCSRDLRNIDRKFRTLDHVVARENGGCNSAHNLVTCCVWCNSSKQDTPLHQFIDDHSAAQVIIQINKPVDRAIGKRLVNLERIVA